MVHKAVILAGGKGTRLGNISKKIPKSLQLINGIPILHHQISLISKYGVKEIYIITNYLTEKIEDSLQQIKTQKHLKIVVHKESKELGTVGGIKEIEHELTENFFVLYGDIMLDVDLNRVAKFHSKKNSDATLVVHPTDHPKDSDLVGVNTSDKIIEFYPKYSRDLTAVYPNISNAGLYLFSPKLFPFLTKGVKADFGKDIFPNIINKLNMYGYNTPEYLKDMGTPDRIEKVRKDFKNGIVQAKNLEQKQKAIFIDRDGVINKLAGYISKPAQLEVFENAITAIKKINTSDFLAIVITNQPVVARGLCSIEELQKIHHTLEFTLGNSGAKLDAIFFCPHHPDTGFEGENLTYKKECTCRKPKIGMIENAVEQFNIDVTKSYFIGDTWRDIECGTNAKIKTILVGNSKEEVKVTPTSRAENLLEAVHQIIK
ncbi:D-glycero-beta-D-manno-heptose-1,7-bisphosphate 7-phosphatase [Kordia antarctica]|uniref:D-glycero-beta-D-manno-heptose-1,7-bisphosphate 7-phosphatase n=1 Tax=Kordia antarctica TaxID=1218801 RepID=A0A7L4ZFN0_9FLAO|nr:HAD-IIIA family hydrolase [Kordia antarctica]QHI35425.1 D-glycero-beta-D-manno-heptose-1,7-bisphosphate 7-phosphatase [Kordia antarctica]